MVIKTANGIEGHGLTFTCGRGTEIVVAAVNSFKPLVVGLTAIDIYRDFAGFWRSLTSESQLRWVSRRENKKLRSIDETSGTSRGVGTGHHMTGERVWLKSRTFDFRYGLCNLLEDVCSGLSKNYFPDSLHTTSDSSIFRKK